MCSSTVEVGPGGMPIRYKDVAPSVDLLLTSLTAYSANDPEKNGRSGCFGQVNIAAPGVAEIKFALVHAGTDTPVPAGSTYEMTIFDLDTAQNGMTEKVGVSGHSSIEAVALRPSVTSSGMTWFEATT